VSAQKAWVNGGLALLMPIRFNKKHYWPPSKRRFPFLAPAAQRPNDVGGVNPKQPQQALIRPLQTK
jgi:hypothetical protein